jgi:gamma-glutamyltranspeptidase/glutathione hydrolase
MQLSTTTTGRSGGRPQIMATRGVVSSGHYLATDIGLDLLKRGGNAADAAAAVGFALTVLKPHQNGIGGEVPILLWSSAEERSFAVSGHGVAPRAATLAHFAELGLKLIPGDGFLPALVPPAPATWLLLLERFGSKRLCEVLEPAIDLARAGFPMYESLRNTIAGSAERFRREWPSSAATFLVDGQPPALGTVWRQPAWALTFEKLAAADRREKDREAGLRRARELFYGGRIAATIVDFAGSAPVRDASGEAHTSLLTCADFADFRAQLEEPVATQYRDLQVLKCSAWTQGPVLLQALNLLRGFDLRALGHNSAEYIHAVVECMKLAFADREFYYGDPAFVAVPFGRLLSEEYAVERRRLIDAERASLELRPGGQPPLAARSVADVNAAFAAAAGGGDHGDTTKLEVIDREGNMVSATPSGGWLQSSPVVPGLGFPLGTRGQMFSLVPGHPNCLAPGKRPRTTLTPSLALREGKPYLAFGSPGGDSQDQWALQFLLNVVEFGMSLQEAVEAPTFTSQHWPSSFYPRACKPGGLAVEGRIEGSVCEELRARGHLLAVEADFSGGNTLAAGIDQSAGVLHAAASPRLDPAYAAGW